MDGGEQRRPRGFLPIGAFLIFGAIMAAYAAITLLHPGTDLDRLWALNQTEHARLTALGKSSGIGFIFLSAFMVVASAGWLRRRRWGWVLGTTIVTLNAAGDVVNAIMGEPLKGAVGVAIAGLLLFYMTRSAVKNYFKRG